MSLLMYLCLLLLCRSMSAANECSMDLGTPFFPDSAANVSLTLSPAERAGHWRLTRGSHRLEMTADELAQRARRPLLVDDADLESPRR